MNTPVSKPWPFPTHDSIHGKSKDELSAAGLSVGQQYDTLTEYGQKVAAAMMNALVKVHGVKP
jgi:hypothetical protein